MNNTIEDCKPEHNDHGEKDTDYEPLANPTPPPNVDWDKLRGDRIGDTVYSGKWCIQTIMKLMQSNVVVKAGEKETSEETANIVNMEEELQNEVGALWDMTINLDVSMYLHSVGAVDSICYIILNSASPRATEMCVGMLANIISHNELWEIFHTETTVFKILINLLTHIDQPVLVEVTRFLNTAICHEDNFNCYSILCENGVMVMQELMRILSGSANVDLLKQVAELTYSLMLLDEKEIYFCALFAEPDFVAAAVEASKELGYQHETSGQNYLIQVLHYFTTYEAGALAIGSCMGQIAEISILYLRLLCQNLNLNNSTSIITSMIAILNHIFSRQMMVHLELISSPSFIHCILKTLVAVYRKLGYYNSLVSPKGQNTSKKWKIEDDFPEQAKITDTVSWSERATTTSLTRTAFQTPDASPYQSQQTKELEVSWSERRMSSPPNNDFFEENWKIPNEKKLKQTKRIGEGYREGGSTAERNIIDSDNKDKCSECDLRKETQSDSFHKETNSLFEQADLQECNKSLDEVDATKNENMNRFSNSDGIRLSGEFTIQDHFEEMDSEKVENDIPLSIFDNSKPAKINDENSLSASCSKENNKDSNENESSSTKTLIDDTSSQIKLVIAMSCEKKDNATSPNDNGIDDSSDDISEDNNGGFNDVENENTVNSSDGLNGDRYHKLLEVITELLQEYFNNLGETISKEDGVPYFKDVMIYFNKQCSSEEIRAIVKCVGTNTGATKPLGRLLHLCDHFKAMRMKSVLLNYINKESQS